MRNGGPLVISLLCVMLWGTIQAVRDAARQYQSADRFDIFEDEDES